MREPTERDVIRKDEVLKKCFECIVEVGIEGASIRNFSDVTGMSSSSLYYWFVDKDEIVLNSAEYAVREIVDKLFDYTMKNIGNIQSMCEEFPEMVKKNERELRAIFQIATSPQYGNAVIKMSEGFTSLYDIYSMRLAKQLEVEYETVRQFVNLFISSIVDCVIWKNWGKFSEELKFILKLIDKERK